MKAMVLAAGVGCRLRPLTDEIPKALYPKRSEKLLITYFKLFDSDQLNIPPAKRRYLARLCPGRCAQVEYTLPPARVEKYRRDHARYVLHIYFTVNI